MERGETAGEAGGDCLLTRPVLPCPPSLLFPLSSGYSAEAEGGGAAGGEGGDGVDE